MLRNLEISEILLYEKVRKLVLNGDVKIIKILDKKQITIDQHFGSSAKRGPTLIHFAARKPKGLPLLKILVNYPNVNLNAKDNNGFTPFYYAVSNKNIAAIEILLQAISKEVATIIEVQKDPNLAYWLQNEDLDFAQTISKMIFSHKHDVFSKAARETNGNLRNRKNPYSFYASAKPKRQIDNFPDSQSKKMV